MSISFEEIRKLARLSKLQISAENEHLVKERLENVLALVDQLQEAETKNTNVESSRTDYSQRLRSDKEVRQEKVVVDFHMAPKLQMFWVLRYILLHFDIYAVRFGKGFLRLCHLEVDRHLGLGIGCILGRPCVVH